VRYAQLLQARGLREEARKIARELRRGASPGHYRCAASGWKQPSAGVGRSAQRGERRDDAERQRIRRAATTTVPELPPLELPAAISLTHTREAGIGAAGGAEELAAFEPITTSALSTRPESSVTVSMT
jgi:hypothetical protein